MAFRLPRLAKPGSQRPLCRRANVVALIGLSIVFVSAADAQAIGDGHSNAAVTIDDSVLEQLGPPLDPKTSRPSTVHAPANTASSLNRIIHLIPPKSHLASSAPAVSRKFPRDAAASAPTKPAVAALAAPRSTSLPKQPASSNAPTPRAAPLPHAAPVPAPSDAAAAATSVTAPPAASTPSATVSPPAPVAVAPPVQVATATTAGSAAMTVKFKAGATDLGGGDQPVLDAIVNRLAANQELRVQLVSHATGGAEDAMEARRVSLARAVAVRAYLIDKGVRSLRIDVRALGNRADTGPVADQVDLLVVSQ